MWQVGICGIQAEAVAEYTRIAELVSHLVSHDVAFLGDYLERYLYPTLLCVVLHLIDDELKSEIIGKSVGIYLDYSGEGLTLSLIHI